MVWGCAAVSAHVYRKWPTKASKKCWECGAQGLRSHRRAARARAVSYRSRIGKTNGICAPAAALQLTGVLRGPSVSSASTSQKLVIVTLPSGKCATISSVPPMASMKRRRLLTYISARCSILALAG